jgi:hypothetical protein
MMDKEAGVCHSCGKNHAPTLAALLVLAQVARRVGNIGRHTVVPPMEALLDLARAAEEFTYLASGQCRPTAGPHGTNRIKQMARH